MNQVIILNHASLFPQESSSYTFYVRVTFNSATFSKSSEKKLLKGQLRKPAYGFDAVQAGPTPAVPASLSQMFPSKLFMRVLAQRQSHEQRTEGNEIGQCQRVLPTPDDSYSRSLLCCKLTPEHPPNSSSS